MDEAKRAALKARRDAILAEAAERDLERRRAEFVRMVPILSALEDAGEPYDSAGYRSLRGPLNGWAHDPRLYAMRETSHAKLLHDPAQRNAVIVAHLKERFGEDDPMTVILRTEDLVLTLRLPVLVRHLDTLFDNARSNWLAFAAPPERWIVATHHVDTLGISEIVTVMLE